MFVGARFPADAAYRSTIARTGLAIGQRLAGMGVIGYLGVDFVVVCARGGEWKPFALEINLRQGGTTPPSRCCKA